MRKVVLDLAITLDGFIEGPNGEIDWCIMDDDMQFDKFLDSIDTIFYGRVSYDMWGNYQAEAGATQAEKQLWEAVHSKNKYVFSHTAKDDGKATIIAGDIEKRVIELKNTPGKNIWLYGGAGLITTFIELGLIDVYRLSVHPVALGNGKPLFKDLNQRLNLNLADTKVFKSGVVQLIYEPLEN
jgi:dihydrofolate reductase